jgi:hypothetical protein
MDSAHEAMNIPRRAFDAMEVQGVRVCEALHKGCSARNRWQMPSMQEHRIQTCVVTAINAASAASVSAESVLSQRAVAVVEESAQALRV